MCSRVLGVGCRVWSWFRVQIRGVGCRVLGVLVQGDSVFEFSQKGPEARNPLSPAFERSRRMGVKKRHST